MRRRKPDIMAVLILLIGLGVLGTGFLQGYQNGFPSQSQARYDAPRT